MKKIDVGYAVNTLANVGVIVGIGFLALELNQNNKLLQAEAIGAVLETRIARNEAIAVNQGLAEVLAKSAQDTALTDVELMRFEALLVRTVLGWEREFFLFQEGILGRDQFAANIPLMRQAFRGTRRSYGMRDYWQSAGHNRASPSFRDFVEECVIVDCDDFPLD